MMPVFALPPVKVSYAHPQLGNTAWFTIDKKGLEVYSKESEMELVSKLHDIFEKWTTFYYVRSKGASTKKEYGKEECMELLIQNPYFGKWWKEVTVKYKAAITGKKFGL